MRSTLLRLVVGCALVASGLLLIGSPSATADPVGMFSEFPVPTAHARPEFINVGPDGNLWFTEGQVDKLAKMTPSGVITEYPTTPGGAPSAILAGSDNDLWITEW